MTVVVTGAAGHLGANLVRELVARDRAVRAVVYRDERALAGLPVERVRADVRDPMSLHRAFAGADVVYHLAAAIALGSGDGQRLGPVNAAGAANVARACLSNGVRRLVHFSSIHAFAGHDTAAPLDERKRPCTDGHSYGHSKADGEAQVLRQVSRGLDAVIVNPTAVLGPYDFKPSPMGDVLLSLFRRRMPALVDGGYDWVDVRDVVATALYAEERGRTGERYLVGGRWASIRELAQLAASASGVPAPRLTAPAWLAQLGAPLAEVYYRMRGQRPLFCRESLRTLGGGRAISSEKAARELGHRPRPLAQTIEDTYRWFRDAGLL